jgi:hypothetical protein
MIRKALLVATAAAFFVAVGVPETSFAPGFAFAAKKCGEGMRKNWRGKCVKAKVAKAKMVAKSYKKKGSTKRRKRSKAKEG